MACMDKVDLKWAGIAQRYRNLRANVVNNTKDIYINVWKYMYLIYLPKLQSAVYVTLADRVLIQNDRISQSPAFGFFWMTSHFPVTPEW